MKKGIISEKLIRTVYVLFVLMCMGMLGSTLLYVFVHGMEQGMWELRYVADMAAASAGIGLFRILNRFFCRDRKAREASLTVCAEGTLRLLENGEGISAHRKGKRLTGLACLTVGVLGLAVHLAGTHQIRPLIRGDAGMFFRAAEDLAARRSLRHSDLLALFPHILGYANFLSVFFRQFGNTVAPAVNTALSTLGGLLLFCTVWEDCAEQETDGTVHALKAALSWALLPSAVLYDSLTLSEPLYTAMILLLTLLLTAFNRQGAFEKGRLHVLTAGALTGLLLSVIHAVRTVSSILLVALAIWLVLQRWGEPPTGKNRRSSAAALLCFLLVTVCVYVAGNRLWTGVVTDQLGEEPAGMPWYNMLTGFNEEVSGTHSEEDAQILYAAMRDPGGTARGAQELMRELLKDRLRSGINFPRLYAEKLKLFAGNDDTVIGLTAESMSEEGAEAARHVCNIAYYMLVIAAISGGIRKTKTANSGIALFAALYVLGLTLAHVLLFEVSGRYHYSMLPMLAIVAYGKE